MSLKSYTFTVPGVPKGQARPRFARIGSFVRTYDTKESVAHKQSIAAFAQAAGVRPMTGPVEIVVTALVPRPLRLCRKKDPSGEVEAICKPDCDNIAKAVCDALIGVAYADDAQVWKCTILKMYHAKDGWPETAVEIRGLI